MSFIQYYHFLCFSLFKETLYISLLPTSSRFHPLVQVITSILLSLVSHLLFWVSKCISSFETNCQSRVLANIILFIVFRCGDIMFCFVCLQKFSKTLLLRILLLRLVYLAGSIISLYGANLLLPSCPTRYSVTIVCSKFLKRQILDK